MPKKRPKLLGSGDAARLMGVSQIYLAHLTNTKRLYCQITSAGRIFFEEDVKEFQRKRIEKAKTDSRIKLKRS